jgi:hypothetical protein
MATTKAPLDPLFWVHIANVDRLWASWVQAHPTSWEREFLDLELPPVMIGEAVGYHVREIIDTGRLGYAYDNVSVPVLLISPTPVKPLVQRFDLGLEITPNTPVTAKVELSDELLQAIEPMLRAGKVEDWTLPIDLEIVPKNDSGWMRISVYLNSPDFPAVQGRNDPHWMGENPFNGSKRLPPKLTIHYDFGRTLARIALEPDRKEFELQFFLSVDRAVGAPALTLNAATIRHVVAKKFASDVPRGTD